MYLARVEDPAQNLSLLTEPRRFSEVCDAGVVVTNGTFFAPSQPYADVIVSGDVVYSPVGGGRRFKRDERWVDLGRRWGIGVLKGSRSLAVADGDQALQTMETFLGGGGLLLEGGQDATSKDQPVADSYGPAFPADILERRTSHVALGLKTEAGKQVLLVLVVKDPPGASIKELAALMKEQGAEDAVFYDGGGATGFAAGGCCLVEPSNPGEDRNPTHIVIKACR
jgi:hypothetical protein